MSQRLAGLALAAMLLVGGAGPANASYRDGNGRCDGREGTCNDQRHCAENEGDCTDNHRSFSPTFDKSPVDHSFNFSPTICLPGSTCNTGGDDQKKPPPDQGQKPTSLTDPRKLPMVIAQITKSGLDLGQLFADGTIKFVEGLFTALA